jgi:anti-anti-sigma regulatory factor
MATALEIVRFHAAEDVVTFRVEGRGTMRMSLPLRRCAERFLDAGTRRVRIDLRLCTYMDSTFLGTLLTLKKTLAARGLPELILIAPSVPCSRILQQMGLAEMLPIESGDTEPAAGWTELTADGDDSSFKRNIKQAHEELASLPGPAGEQFQAVVRCMAQAEKDKRIAPPAQVPSPPKE